MAHGYSGTLERALKDFLVIHEDVQRKMEVDKIWNLESYPNMANFQNPELRIWEVNGLVKLITGYKVL